MHRLCSVYGNSNIAGTEICQPIRRIIIYQGAVRRERNPQSLGFGVFGEIADIGTAERFTARKEQNGHLPCRKIINDRSRLGIVQHPFHQVFPRRGCRVAVCAGEIAGRSHVPYDHRLSVNVLRVPETVIRLVAAEEKFAYACQFSGVSTMLRKSASEWSP